MAYFYIARKTSLITAVFGAVVNFALAVQLIGAWHTLSWEVESEWEGSGYSISRDGIRLICALFATYFASASSICFFGLVGILKINPSFVRVYRDFSICNFSLSMLLAFSCSTAALRPSIRVSTCEHLSRQPGLLRDVIGLGLNLENCEEWFESAAWAFVGASVVVTVIRFHFLVSLSNYYTHLQRYYLHQSDLPQTTLFNTHLGQMASESEPLSKIYLLPTTTSSRLYHDEDYDGYEDELTPIYAPVPLSAISQQEAQELRANAAEAWVSLESRTRSLFVRSHADAQNQLEKHISAGSAHIYGHEDISPFFDVKV